MLPRLSESIVHLPHPHICTSGTITESTHQIAILAVVASSRLTALHGLANLGCVPMHMYDGGDVVPVYCMQLIPHALPEIELFLQFN